MTELMPCPFCGSEHVKLQHYKVDPNDWWYVSCCECQIAMDPLNWDCQTREQAIERWNKRYLNGMPISPHTMVPRDEE